MTALDALPPRLQTKIRVNSETGCWEWVGSITATGYGRAWDDELKRADWAHRVIYRRLVGPIPVGLTLDHLCRVRHCVNPAMLEPVSQLVNNVRGIGPAVTRKRHRSKTHCHRGHPLSGENVNIRNGRRHCLMCAKTYAAAYRDRNRDAIQARDRERWRQRADVLLELANA